MSPHLVLQFLGLPQLYLDNQPIVTDRRKAIALLAYLAVNDIGHTRQRYSRESLSALFWPDYEQSRAFSNLRRTIWEVHQVLGEGWLIADRESVQLNPEAKIDLDIAHFQDLLSKSHQPNDPTLRIPRLVEATKLYRNHFLTGFSLKDAFPFNEWAYSEAEDLRRKLADALIMLIESHCSLNEAESAIPYARRLISLDPLNESAHRQLMEVYIQAGQHSAALKQYQICEQTLRKELNLDPQAETQALYKKIRRRGAQATETKEPKEAIIPKHNLPSHLSKFIGREKERDEITNLIARNRLVTLAGTGGIGKTRLSLQVGQRFLSNYPNGVWFIPLDSLSDPSLVAQTVAAAFDIRETSDHPVTEILINVLREKTTLLILDNCEHLLDSCAQLIKTLLQNCPNLKILATSREILNVTGEATYYVPVLSIPERDGASAKKLNDYESIQLFVERATLASSSFALTNENAHTIVDICRRVDGIPLAIELAAARVNILQVEEILKQLQDSFSLLANNSRSILPRHQTLQASMYWSWRLLNEAERIFLQQLSVFAGGWTLESAQVVCDGDVLALTSALVKKSLIGVDQEAGRETRYRFHEMVRQYVRQKLVETGEEENIRNRHLKYFLQLSEQAETALRGSMQVKWYERLNDERDNIRAALEWAARTDVEAGLYLSGRLNVFWELFDIRGGSRWLEVFIQKPESKSYPRARAMALLAQGFFLFVFERFAEAQAAAQECLDLYRTCGDTQGEIDALLVLAFQVENAAEGRELLQHALVLAQSINDKWRQARVLSALGSGMLEDKQYIHLKEALKIFQEVGDLYNIAAVMAELGRLEMLKDNIESAQKILNDAVILIRQLNLKNPMADVLQEYGRIAAIKGDYEQAYADLQESAAIYEEQGIRLAYLFSRAHLGYLALYQGEITNARSIFSETARDFYSDKNEDGVMFTLEGIGGLSVAVGKPDVAAQLIGWADMVREKLSDPRPPLEQADVDKIIAACLIKMGEVAFSDAYDEGQGMTMDEAVAYALDED